MSLTITESGNNNSFESLSEYIDNCYSLTEGKIPRVPHFFIPKFERENNYFIIPGINSFASTGYYYDLRKLEDMTSVDNQLKKNLQTEELKETDRKIDEKTEGDTKKLVQELSKITDERESFYSSEHLFNDILRQNKNIAGNVLQDIYLRYTDCVNIILGICNILRSYDFDEVDPWGPTIVLGLMNHKSDEVKEAVISVIDNWENPDMLPALKNIECVSPWMQDYINSVIGHLDA